MADAIFAQWQTDLPRHQITANMMRWMKHYTVPCDRRCCYSMLCAAIRCSGCHMLLSTSPPKPRFVCTQCPILSLDESHDPTPELCQACFASHTAIPHQHGVFCHISGTGEHTMALRPVTVAREAGAEDLRELAAWPEGVECVVCCSTDQPATCMRSCSADPGHGQPVTMADGKVVDGGQYLCSDCMLVWFGTQRAVVYADTRLPCQVCHFDRQLQAWAADFANGASLVRGPMLRDDPAGLARALSQLLTIDEVDLSASDLPAATAAVSAALKSLHRQPYLQTLIDIAFQ